jgi:hypothetical protein
MLTEEKEIVQDSDTCPSDDKHDRPNATDEDASPSQYKKDTKIAARLKELAKKRNEYPVMLYMNSDELYIFC